MEVRDRAEAERQAGRSVDQAMEAGTAAFGDRARTWSARSRSSNDQRQSARPDREWVEKCQQGGPRIGSSSEGRHLKLKLVRRIKAGHMLLATAAWLAKARKKRQNSCRLGVHSENLGYVYFLY
jgi:hypothetical protein